MTRPVYDRNWCHMRDLCYVCGARLNGLTVDHGLCGPCYQALEDGAMCMGCGVINVTLLRDLDQRRRPFPRCEDCHDDHRAAQWRRARSRRRGEPAPPPERGQIV